MTRNWCLPAAIVGIGAALALNAPAGAFIEFDDVLIEYWTGSGDNEALLIVDWQNEHMLAFGYRWDVVEEPTDLELLEAVNDASDRFYREWVDGMPEEAVFGIGWDVDLDGFGKTDPDDWYEEGWLENGYWSQWLSTDGENWDWSGGLGTHDLVHGDWVGWSWAPDFQSTPPDVPLVPAPATPAALAALALGASRRRR
ncbi:MAG: hypothetical protein SYC29_06695 [Planctomycetota bacterium]|nr:hypothetical protein [Planctomycetota bacterium]